MRVALIFVVLLAAAQPGATFDFSSITSFWEGVKEKIETFIRGNGTITDEQALLLEKLNATSSEMGDFHERLKEIRELVKDQLKSTENSIDKKALEKMLKKFGSRIREHIRKTGDNLEEVNANLNVADQYYQGDMILTNQQMDQMDQNVNKRQAFVDGTVGRRWGTVYYSFAAGIKAHTRTVAEMAIKFWQSNTCVNFAFSETQARRINVFEGQGCYSYVGSIGRTQELSLGQGCDSFGTAAHEFGHALGFFHAQSRADRDTAITLIPANVQNGWLDQFNKETDRTNNNFGMPYDYGSVMQYAGTSASRNGQPTMMAKVPQYQVLYQESSVHYQEKGAVSQSSAHTTLIQDTMGSDIVSFVDVSMMNTLYGCKEKCASSPTRCQNGGFPHPRDCTKCLCPAGFGGNFCNERPTGCGETLVATKAAKTLSYKAPAATDRIQVTITSYARNACTSGCVYGGVELKWRRDPTLSGSRYCCPNDVSETVTSESNILPVIGYNRYGAESFTLTYRIL
ncbi:nas-31 [Pristionchus pacificus]|uniref:Zinc metalloproteinase n=1 Tax=Pristionchus pacificus TaxID=54126 RepID=A0A2A6BG68_PRIPA|nr:nas-31 [Pristionchus pacificus]|eukprot:PDM64848.1 nas-31 [Pristionchus pacificus]